MIVPLHQLTAAIYLLASIVAGLGMSVPSRRAARIAVGLLVLGAVVHGATFSIFHMAESPPGITELPAAVSFMAWVGTFFFLILMLRRKHLARLVVLVAPVSFLGVFFAALRLPSAGPAAGLGSGTWPHAHVLLASAGLSLGGIAALAGVLFLTEHGRLKAKRPLPAWLNLPSLESLDRVGAAALAIGFPLLTLGVIAGMIWLQTLEGRGWPTTAHELWTLVAWVVYAVLVTLRFTSLQGARSAAAFAVGGFAFLLFAVIGVGLLP
ncbi:MAG: cytochrome c biogenesis protein [Myxococcales bacterium]|nr:cytochrome c biogenesis protein [Myxococcales bacterium]